ncbi:50S ribosomal protein L24 [Candidatus Liberibacter americanus]|uniref:Large ribosomal subunit protein uL24 n=1 Tax=Candidatus Liberibacter americanus str. Sao Paulo TaxID=1261131 RepID=U6B661_9HYPH|nr:50S ribosomal protein L24 [Candidatus Liberibacter americanus]AHA28264.1 Ribosomal protein L24 [Candidatus Liberibacter americanus str. Sao Paulo]EMS36222.1 50S ribosomal protein L24 [Candidatus Liberibacter americanus PW_SP]
MKKIRTGDRVIVLAGKDKGRIGQVMKVCRKYGRAFVQGINIVKRHQRQTPTQEAGIFSKESSIDLSNISLVGKCGKGVRVGFSIVDGKKIRVEKRSGEPI